MIVVGGNSLSFMNWSHIIWWEGGVREVMRGGAPFLDQQTDQISYCNAQCAMCNCVISTVHQSVICFQVDLHKFSV